MAVQIMERPASLKMTSSNLTANRAGSWGGGISLDSGTMRLHTVQFHANRASGSGGGLHLTGNKENPSHLEIQDSTFALNTVGSTDVRKNGENLESYMVGSVTAAGSLKVTRSVFRHGGILIRGSHTPLENATGPGVDPEFLHSTIDTVTLVAAVATFTSCELGSLKVSNPMEQRS